MCLSLTDAVHPEGSPGSCRGWTPAVLSMGLSEYHPKLWLCPWYRVSCAHNTWNLWEKDGIQKLLNMYLFFLTPGLFARNMCCLFSHYFATKEEVKSIRENVCPLFWKLHGIIDPLPWWQRHFSSPREIRYCFWAICVFLFLWVWYNGSEIFEN